MIYFELKLTNELNLLGRSIYNQITFYNSFLFEYKDNLFFYIKEDRINTRKIIYKIDLFKNTHEIITKRIFMKENHITNFNKLIKNDNCNIISFYEDKNKIVSKFQREVMGKFLGNYGVYNKINKTFQIFDEIKNEKISKHFVLNSGKMVCFLKFRKRSNVIKFYFFDVEV